MAATEKATEKTRTEEKCLEAEQIGPRNSGPALSLIGLLAKYSFSKILAAAAIMAAAEGILFFCGLQKNPDRSTFQFLIDDRHIPAIFLAALGAVYFILTWTEGRLEDQSYNTLLRIPLSQKQFFFLKTVWNFFCLALLFALQIWLLFAMTEVFVRKTGAESASLWQLFLAASCSEFFHCLLPMADILKWVRNFLLLMAFGTEASFGIRQKNYVLFALLLSITTLCFTSPINATLTDTACCALYAAGIGISIRKAGSLTADNL